MTTIRERAEHLLTLADDYHEIEENPYHLADEAVWAARQLFEALGRIETASKWHAPLSHGVLGELCRHCAAPRPCPTWLALNPKEADDG